MSLFEAVFGKKSGSVSINGRSFSGQNINIVGGVVTVDGVVQEGGEFTEKVLNITVEGDMQSLRTSNGSVTVNGSVGKVETTNGSVLVDQGVGSVRTTNGNVTAETITGSVNTVNGNIRSKKP